MIIFHKKYRPGYLSSCFFLLLLITPGCKMYKSPSRLSIGEIKGFSSEGIKDGKLNFSLKTHLNNPSKIAFKMKKAELDILLSGVRVAQIKTSRKIRIKRELNPEIQWNATAEFKPLLSRPGSLLGSVLTGNLTVEVDGRIVVSRFFIKKTIPIRQSISLPLR